MAIVINFDAERAIDIRAFNVEGGDRSISPNARFPKTVLIIS